MKSKSNDKTEADGGKELENTNSSQTDDCEEFRDRMQTIIDGLGKRYGAFQEDLPRLPVYHPSFKKVETLCISLVKEAQTLLTISSYQDEETARLIKLVSESQTVQYPPARRIGLIGDSGAGKSSLVNALLDSPGLALEGASGRAATCVITEYKHAWPGQKTAYMAEIKFYGLDKIRKVIEHEFRAYYNYSIADISHEHQEIQEELSVCHETAVETFKALFADKEEFRTDDAMEEFFKAATSAEDKNMLRILYKWVEGIMLRYGAEDGVLCLDAHGVEELAGKVGPFAQTVTSMVEDDFRRTPSLWPLVEIIRVGLQSKLLNHGLVIADLPGLSDVNKTRTRTTIEYIRACEAALLVAPVARVETDSGVHKRLGWIHRMFGNKKALVVTKTDESRALNRISELEPSPEAAKEHKRLDLATKSTTNEISRLGNIKSTARGMSKETLTQQISKLMLEKKALIVLERQASIVMRNEKTARAIRQKYKKITSDQLPLHFFAVSSSDYIVQTVGVSPEDVFPLPVDTTGIPALRRHCYQIPAKSRLDALTHYREGILAELISSLYMWSSQYKVQRRSTLRKVVEKPLQETGAIIGNCVTGIKLLLESCILEKSVQLQDSWIDHNTRHFNIWAKWHPQTFDAFCRHDGVWETGKQPFYNWNAKMLEPVVEDLTAEWENFDEDLMKCIEKYHSALINLLENIRTDFREIDGVAAEPMLPFLASLTIRKAQLRIQLEEFFNQVKSTSRTTRLHVDTIDQNPDCFLMRAMTPVYAKCRKISAKTGHRNLHTARCTLLEDAISKGEQFSGINSEIKKCFEHGLETLQPRLLEDVQKIFQRVLQDFDSMFVMEEVPNPKRDALRREIQRFVSQARAQIDGPIEISFAQATQECA